MRHGPQQRRLDGVRPAQGGGLDDPAQQRLALERRAQQGLQRRHNTLLQPAQAGLRGARAHQQCAQAVGPFAQREGDAALVRLDRIHLDRCGAQLECLRETRRGGRQDLSEIVTPQQQPRHLRSEVGLASALLRVTRARAGDLSDRAGKRGDHQERRQRNPVARVLQREAPDRR